MHFFLPLGSSRTLTATLLVATISSLAIAAPCVQFDVASSVEATDVTSAEFRDSHAHEKLVRIRFHISSLVRLGSEESLVQYLYLISGTGPFQIIDYAPKTKLASDIAGNVAVEQHQGESNTLALQAQLPRELPVKGDATASRGNTTDATRRYEQLPELHLLAASGTMHRGRSAYFKLKPSRRTTLEGDRVFEVVARVPANWRAGLAILQCQAFERPHSVIPLREESLVCGLHGFVVGLYVQGDVEAQQSVQRLVLSQARLKQLARVHADAVELGRHPDLGHKLGAALRLVKPRIPDRWLEQILASTQHHGFERHLPDLLQDAAMEYRSARREVDRLAGHGVYTISNSAAKLGSNPKISQSS